MAITLKTNFDYADLSPEVATLAKEAAIEIKFRERAIYENIIEIGNRLIAVKNALPHGMFEEWVKKEFQWSIRSAYRYIKIADELGSNVPRVAGLQIGLRPLELLASVLSKAIE